MSGAVVTQSGPGRYAVEGPLRFETVPALWWQTRAVFIESPPTVVDLAAVTEADSAGLALLVEWVREARRAGLALRFENIPPQLQAIARVSRLDALLSSELVKNAH